MFEIMVCKSFAAAHNLREYKGKCEALHGHNYKVWLKVSADSTDEKGLVVDFNEIKTVLKNTLSKFDHAYLNEIDFFKEHNPTSELLSKYIFEEIWLRLEKNYPFLTLNEVRVWETPSSCAIYRK